MRGIGDSEVRSGQACTQRELQGLDDQRAVSVVGMEIESTVRSYTKWLLFLFLQMRDGVHPDTANCAQMGSEESKLSSSERI